MKRSSSFAYVGLFALVALLAFSLTAWNQSAPPPPASVNDTVPRKGDHKVRNIEEAIAELERAQQQLEAELKKPLPPVPPIDAEKMRADIDKALKDMDPEKIQAQVEKAMKELDSAQLKHEIQASLAKADMEKMKVQLEKLRNEELPRIEAQMKNIQPQIETGIKQAKESMEKAKKEMQDYKDFIDGLEKDGLINKSGDYKIKHEDGQLKINGQTQGADVYNKYRTFLEQHKDFTIKKEGDEFNIHKD